MVSKIVPLILLCLHLAACGTAEPVNNDLTPSGSEPVLMEVAPATAQGGDQVTLKGVGFSIVPEENIVTIDGHSVSAGGYSLTSEEGRPEAITFTVPAGLAAGNHNITVTVFDITSNTLTFNLTTP